MLGAKVAHFTLITTGNSCDDKKWWELSLTEKPKQVPADGIWIIEFWLLIILTVHWRLCLCILLFNKSSRESHYLFTEVQEYQGMMAGKRRTIKNFHFKKRENLSVRPHFQKHKNRIWQEETLPSPRTAPTAVFLNIGRSILVHFMAINRKYWE